MRRRLLANIAYPSSHILAHLLFKHAAESRVTAVATLLCQLLDSEITLVGDRLAIETDEMIDAQVVDIGIVCSMLTGEILTEIGAVGSA